MNKSRFQFSWLIVAFATIGATGCTNGVDIAKETDAVRARSKGVSTAESAKDTQGAIAFWAEDAIMQPAGSPQIQGIKAITDVYHQFFENSAFKGISSTISNITVSQSGDLAYEYGVNRMVWTSSKGDLLDMGKYLLVWKKVKDNWFIAALAFTSDAPAPVPLEAGK
jgi:ketosteroid isomerase-like protein